MDADITLVDVTAQVTLHKEHLFQKHRFSPYTGKSFRGVICRTLLRGRTIFADGKILTDNPGRLVRPIFETVSPVTHSVAHLV
jgi:allantoinase